MPGKRHELTFVLYFRRLAARCLLCGGSLLRVSFGFDVEGLSENASYTFLVEGALRDK